MQAGRLFVGESFLGLWCPFWYVAWHLWSLSFQNFYLVQHLASIFQYVMFLWQCRGTMHCAKKHMCYVSWSTSWQEPLNIHFYRMFSRNGNPAYCFFHIHVLSFCQMALDLESIGWQYLPWKWTIRFCRLFLFPCSCLRCNLNTNFLFLFTSNFRYRLVIFSVWQKFGTWLFSWDGKLNKDLFQYHF